MADNYEYDGKGKRRKILPPGYPAQPWEDDPDAKQPGSTLGPGGYKAGTEPDYENMTDEEIEKLGSPLARAGAKAKRDAARRKRQAKEQGQALK